MDDEKIQYAVTASVTLYVDAHPHMADPAHYAKCEALRWLRNAMLEQTPVYSVQATLSEMTAEKIDE